VSSEAAKEVIWLRRLLGDLGINQAEATEMFMDNKANISLARGNGITEGSKHIEIRHLYVQ
jgi:hypothetical protein